MADKSNILDLEINGIVVDRCKYFGRLDMYRVIENLKRVYNLNEGDDYEFFCYKTVADNSIKNKDDWDWAIFKWESKQRKK